MIRLFAATTALLLSAGAVLSMLPLVLVFLFLQRYFIAGSIAGALKE